MEFSNIIPNKIKRESSDDNIASVLTRTESEQNIMSRTLQFKFRNSSLELWKNECAATQINCPKIILAINIKPWREATNEDRVDKYNSLLLSPTYDELFDLAFITFDQDSEK